MQVKKLVSDAWHELSREEQQQWRGPGIGPCPPSWKAEIEAGRLARGLEVAAIEPEVEAVYTDMDGVQAAAKAEVEAVFTAAQADAQAKMMAEITKLSGRLAETERVAAERVAAERVAAERVAAKSVAAERVAAERAALKQPNAGADGGAVAQPDVAAELDRLHAQVTQLSAEKVAAERVESERSAAERAVLKRPNAGADGGAAAQPEVAAELARLRAQVAHLCGGAASASPFSAAAGPAASPFSASPFTASPMALLQTASMSQGTLLSQQRMERAQAQELAHQQQQLAMIVQMQQQQQLEQQQRQPPSRWSWM